MKGHQDSSENSPEEQVTFESLPSELQEFIFSFVIPDIKSFMNLRAVSTKSKELVDSMLDRLTRPKKLFEILSHLPPSQAMTFIKYYRGTNAFSKLHEQYKNIINRQHMDPYEILCFALTTNDVTTINPKELETAITLTSDSTKADEEINACLDGLRITAHLLKPKPGVLETKDMFKTETFINLAGLDLSDKKLTLVPKLTAHLQGANLQKADLGGAYLMEANLQKADLRKAYLAMANLRAATLIGATFQGATLVAANLRGATLIGTNLQGANLQGADLAKTDFRGADLQGANLQGANLQGANLQEADLAKADFRKANLQGANLQGSIKSGPINLNLYQIRYTELLVKLDAISVASMSTKDKKTTFIKDITDAISKMDDKEDIHSLHDLLQKLNKKYSFVRKEEGIFKLKNEYGDTKTYSTITRMIQKKTTALVKLHQNDLTPEQGEDAGKILSMQAGHFKFSKKKK